MNRRATLCCVLLSLFVAGTAAAQPAILDPDDSVDPRQHYGPVFMSRLVLGAASGFVDDYRPLHQNTTFLNLANSLYWGHFQLDYKHSEVFGKDTPVSVCFCNGKPIYFPTPPSSDFIAAAPPPGTKETMQFAWYHAVGGSAQPPVMLRYRVSLSWQPIETDVTSIASGEKSRVTGREQSLGLDADIYFPVAGHEVLGSLIFARAVRTGTTDDGKQNSLVYISRFPGSTVGPFLVRTTLTIGGVTGRGATGLNIINPAFEAFWHDPKTRMNLHLVWSPLAAKSGAEGWQTHHQIALFAEYPIYVKLF
jgi:hypothetical protein